MQELVFLDRCYKRQIKLKKRIQESIEHPVLKKIDLHISIMYKQREIIVESINSLKLELKTLELSLKTQDQALADIFSDSHQNTSFKSKKEQASKEKNLLVDKEDTRFEILNLISKINLESKKLQQFDFKIQGVKQKRENVRMKLLEKNMAMEKKEIDLKKYIQKLRKKIEKEILEVYDQKSKNFRDPLAILKEGKCSKCLQEISFEKEISYLQCPNCQRIILLTKN